MPDPHSGIIIPKGVQLHNLREDIGERVNLAERHPDVVEDINTVVIDSGVADEAVYRLEELGIKVVVVEAG